MSFVEFARERLLYLAALGFVLVSSVGLSGVESRTVVVKAEVANEVRDDLSPFPALKREVRVPILSAQGVVAVDLGSRVSLYEKNPDLPLLPASTTKIMTALVVFDEYSLNQPLRVDGVTVDGQKMGLVRGEEMVVRGLLDGLLIFSANDAAEVLAMNYPGGREAFVEEMNLMAKRYRLDNTHFENPTGLDGVGHRSTARDLVWLAEVAMQNPVFAEIVRTKTKTVTSTDGLIKHRLVNINELLGEVEGVLGVKTGWTESARENLVTYVERDGRRVLIAVLGSQDRFGETRELIDWIFQAYEWKYLQVPSSTLGAGVADS